MQEVLACLVNSIQKTLQKQPKTDYCPRGSAGGSAEGRASVAAAASSADQAQQRLSSGGGGGIDGATMMDEASHAFVAVGRTLRKQAVMVRANFLPRDAATFLELLLARVHDLVCAHLRKQRVSPLGGIKVSRDLSELNDVAQTLLGGDNAADSGVGGAAAAVGGSGFSASSSPSPLSSPSSPSSSSASAANRQQGMARGLLSAFAGLRETSVVLIASPEQLPALVRDLCATRDEGGRGGGGAAASGVSDLASSGNSGGRGSGGAAGAGGGGSSFHVESGGGGDFVIPHAKRRFIHDLLRCRTDFKDGYGRRAAWVKEHFPDLGSSSSSSSSRGSSAVAGGGGGGEGGSPDQTTGGSSDASTMGAAATAAAASSSSSSSSSSSVSRFSMFSRRS